MTITIPVTYEMTPEGIALLASLKPRYSIHITVSKGKAAPCASRVRKSLKGQRILKLSTCVEGGEVVGETRVSEIRVNGKRVWRTGQ